MTDESANGFNNEITIFSFDSHLAARSTRYVTNRNNPGAGCIDPLPSYIIFQMIIVSSSLVVLTQVLVNYANTKPI
jgi:hypothetical protein